MLEKTDLFTFHFGSDQVTTNLELTDSKSHASVIKWMNLCVFHDVLYNNRVCGLSTFDLYVYQRAKVYYVEV